MLETKFVEETKTHILRSNNLFFRKIVPLNEKMWKNVVESSWNVMAHGDAREGKWRGNWRMKWVVSTLHTTSEHGVSSITTVDAHTSAASSRLNWRPRRFKWTSPFRWKTKSGFCTCAITFQTCSTCLTPVRRLTGIKIACYSEGAIGVCVYDKWTTIRTQYTSQYRNVAGRQ